MVWIGRQQVHERHLQKGSYERNLKEAGVLAKWRKGRGVGEPSMQAWWKEQMPNSRGEREPGQWRDLPAGGCRWSRKWCAKEAGDAAGGPEGARASLACMLLCPCFNGSSSPFHFCVSFSKPSSLCASTTMVSVSQCSLHMLPATWLWTTHLYSKTRLPSQSNEDNIRTHCIKLGAEWVREYKY